MNPMFNPCALRVYRYNAKDKNNTFYALNSVILLDPIVKSRVVTLLEKLIRKPSYEKTIKSACPTCGSINAKTDIDESAVAEVILGELENSAFDIIKQSVEGNRYNIIASLGDPRLVLAGHMDTVPPGDIEKWTVTNPLEPRVKENRLYGLGAVDMKGGIAAILTAVREISEEKADGLWLVFDVDEEYSFKGIEKFADEYESSPKLVLFAEPTDLKITFAHRGCYEIHITVSGESAHAGEPEKGIDAAGLYKILLELRKEILSQEFFHKILGKPSLNVGYFQAGTCEQDKIISRPNKVPDIAFAAVDIRPTPNLELKWIVERLKAKIAEQELTLRNLEIEFSYKPLLPLKMDLGMLENILKSFRMEPQYHVMIGYTEAGILHDKFNVPCMNFGPGPEAEAHKYNEYVYVDNLAKCKEVYKQLIRKLCIQ